jgi:hypothetical protein
MKKLAALFALVATLFSLSPAVAAPPEGPASSISVYAGGAFMRQYYDDCGYYSDYCGGHYDRSDTYSGPEFGVDARIVNVPAVHHWAPRNAQRHRPHGFNGSR